MKKVWILLTALMFVGLGSFSQSRFFIRNFNQSIAVDIGEQTSDNYVFNPYGEILSETSNFDLSYKFQAHEYDVDLGIYYFPRRIYYPSHASFLQPDPKSQYYSPYVFVNGDPINMVDRDGNEGKPLVLYQTDVEAPGGINSSMRDFMDAVPDAHYVPMSDFVNGEMGDLPEWNGNVFLKGHMTDDYKGDIILEEGDFKDRFATRAGRSIRTEEAFNRRFYRTIDGKEMGRLLRSYSEEKGVPINNITAAGCDGSRPARNMRQGFFERDNTLFEDHPVRFTGVNTSRNMFTTGPNSQATAPNSGAYRDTRLHITPDDHERLNPVFRENNQGEQVFDHLEMDYMPGRELPSFQQSELSDFANGRIPQRMSREFSVLNECY